VNCFATFFKAILRRKSNQIQNKNFYFLLGLFLIEKNSNTKKAARFSYFSISVLIFKISNHFQLY